MGRLKQEIIEDESATESDDSKTDTDGDIDNPDHNHDGDGEDGDGDGGGGGGVGDDDEDSPPPPDSAPFAEGEKVLAFHEDRTYVSKVRFFYQLRKWEGNKKGLRKLSHFF